MPCFPSISYLPWRDCITPRCASSPRGARPRSAVQFTGSFGIHTPAWGATGAVGADLHRFGVSIHAPAWRATKGQKPIASIASLRTQIPRLRVTRGNAERSWSRAHRPSHAGCVVPRPEVVVTGFGVAFFAGETGWRKTQCRCTNCRTHHSATPSRRTVITGPQKRGTGGTLILV